MNFSDLVSQVLLNFFGFCEELPLGYEPCQQGHRDLREPLVVVVGGRKRVVDFGVLDPIYEGQS